jgi:hypothetical protein
MEGAKTSFCIEDRDDLGGSDQTYTACSAEEQGISPCWRDTYTSDLDGQWVVLGSQRPADGQYGLQSTLDPRNLLDEGARRRERNNTEVTYFTVTGGQIQVIADSARRDGGQNVSAQNDGPRSAKKHDERQGNGRGNRVR